jgi:glycosyltransferase involved in cell wall biosynthesis
MKIKLSGVIITFNEELKIKQCIESLESVCDEILVVDSFSTDKTKEICETKNVKFICNKFLGHIEQKNFAKNSAKYDHIISLDADELLDEKAQKNILKLKENWAYNGYHFNRLNNYCGKWIKYGSWYPDEKLRLFDRRKGYWGGINPHDQFILTENNPKKKNRRFYFTLYH